MNLKLKLDEKGNAVLNDGKPVYVQEDGKEITYDANVAFAKIAQLNGEAKSHREAKEAAEAKLKDFDGIEDVEAAKKALEIASDLENKKLIDAGEIEKVKENVASTYQKQIDEAKEQTAALEDQLRKEIIGGSFARSNYIRENLSINPDVAQAFFGRHFEVENGELVAKDGSGNVLFSKDINHAGEKAGFEEAIQSLVEQYPAKDTILKSSGSSGSGNQGGSQAKGAPKRFSECKSEDEKIQFLRDATKH